MNLTFVRSAAQARLNLFGRQSAPLQHPGSAALLIPAKISDSIALRRSFPELMGSMFAGDWKLRQWRLVKNHFAGGGIRSRPIRTGVVSFAVLLCDSGVPEIEVRLSLLFSSCWRVRNFLERLYIVWPASDIHADRGNRPETSPNLGKARGGSSLTPPQFEEV
jgi:hypothetical protein